MLNVAKSDPSAFSVCRHLRIWRDGTNGQRHEDEFVALLLQALVTSKWGIEQEYIDTVLSIPRAGDYPLLTAIDPAHYESADRLMEHRGTVIEGRYPACLPTPITSNSSSHTPEHLGPAQVSPGMGCFEETTHVPLPQSFGHWSGIE
jgi:hypothetical protein